MTNKTDLQTYEWLQANPEDGFSRMMQAGYVTEWIAVAQDNEQMNLIVTKNGQVINIAATAKVIKRGNESKVQFWVEMLSGDKKSEITLTPEQFTKLVLDTQ
jgi:hypothetical protein